MKPTPSEALERCRVKHGPGRSDASYGNNGHFRIVTPKGVRLFAIASDGMGWEHVSLHVIDQNRCPTWEEMCYAKSMFWADDETVVQYHPPKSEYVNIHPYVLHLWRPVDQPVPVPPLVCV